MRNYLLLLVALLLPANGYCFKKRDALMIGSGLVVTGLGITFVIKNAKKKKDEPAANQVMIQPWFPTTDQRMYGFERP